MPSVGAVSGPVGSTQRHGGSFLHRPPGRPCLSPWRELQHIVSQMAPPHSAARENGDDQSLLFLMMTFPEDAAASLRERGCGGLGIVAGVALDYGGASDPISRPWPALTT